jgi:membrane protease YdiL (CAAX protease family)
VENQERNVILPFEAVLVIIVTFFLSVFLGAALLLTLGNGPALIIGELLILIIPLSYMLYKRINIRIYIGTRVKPKFILLGLGFGIGLLILDILVTNVLIYIFGVSQAVKDSNAMLINLSSTSSGLIVVAASLVLAGICEEFAFRGFLQNALNHKYSHLSAVVISAAVFGIFHFDPQLVYILSAFISGLALGLIYYRWKSYVVALIAHSTVNMIILVFLLLGW